MFDIMRRSREEIVTAMCYSVRHDYGLDKTSDSPLCCGITSQERIALWNEMVQIFDNEIAPWMKFDEK